MEMPKWLSRIFENHQRMTWQELVGQRPHMIEESMVMMGGGFAARDSYVVTDRIAIVDISGVLVNDADWWDGWGMSTYHRIAGEVRGAAADPEVDAILLGINSPGGETDMAFETADVILAAAKEKPVWAAAGSMAYSAGYLLASSADKLYVSPKSGGVGSIGVYALHMDYSEALAKAGIKPTFMEAGKGKTEGHPYKPLSDSAEAKIQADVDRLYGLFVDYVAKQRGTDAAVIRGFGAKLFNGSEAAIASGLADKAGSFSQAFEALKAKIAPKSQTGFTGFAQAGENDAAVSAANSTKEGTTMPPDKAQAETGPTPAEAAAITEAAKVALAEEARVAYAAAEAERVAAASREAEVARAALADAAEITALCAIAGLPATRVREYIAAKKSPQEVRDELLSARAAEAEKTEIVSQILPHSGTVDESPLVKAAERAAAQQAARKGAA